MSKPSQAKSSTAAGLGHSSDLEYVHQHQRSKLERLERQQLNLKQQVQGSSRFSSEEKSAIEHSTIDDVRRHWAWVNKEAANFDDAQQKGCGLWARRYQKFTTDAGDFVEAFNPVLDAVQDIASPYGGIAIGTISFLFAVSQNKTKTEACITGTLAQIKDSLPGLALRQAIHSGTDDLDHQLQQKLVETYEAFIEFSLKALGYYQSSGPKRWVHALVPASDLIRSSERIQAVTIDMRHICEILVERNIDIVRLDIKGLEKAHDDVRLQSIQRHLGCSSFSEEAHQKDFSSYSGSVIDGQEDWEGRRIERLHDDQALADFKQSGTGTFASWDRSTGSSVLLLVGQNNEVVSWSQQCWTSPVAIDLITQIQQPSHQSPHAFYVVKSEGTLFHDIIPVIILQLVRTRNIALRDDNEHRELMALLENVREAEERDNQTPSLMSPRRREYTNHRIKALHQVALRVIGMFDKSETVHIIIDRLDRCKAGGENEGRTDHRKAILRTLAGMTRGTAAKVKILVVVNHHSWPIDRDFDADEFSGTVLDVREQQQVESW